MHYRDALWGPIALELLSKNEKSIWVLLEHNLRFIILFRQVLCLVRIIALILLNRFKLFFSISVALSENGGSNKIVSQLNN